MEIGVEGLALTDTRLERFARLMAEGKKNQAQAYLEAGYSCSSLAIASAAANRLLKNVKVQARIAYLQQQAAKLATLDASYVLSGLMRNAEAAFEEQDYSASNRALELLGKHLRLWEESPQTQVVQANVMLADEERVELLRAILGKQLEAHRATDHHSV